MGHDGTGEEPREPLVRAHRAEQALPMKDWYSASAQKVDMTPKGEAASKHEEYDMSDELDLYDVEGMDVEKKTVQEQMLELQHMIDACGDGDELVAYSVSPYKSTKPDPVSQLKEKCQVLHKEVTTLTKAKEDMVYELRQNVQHLKERIDDQYREKASLTERLIDAKQKFGSKQQEMLERQQELRDKIDIEREKKEKLQAEFEESLKVLKDQLEDLNQQVQKDWEAQAVLVKELDEESDNQSRCQSELKEARDQSWRQNRDVMNSFAREGKAVPLTLVAGLGDESPQATSPVTNGNDYQPSIRSVWPLGALRSVTGVSLRNVQEKGEKVRELEEQIRFEKLRCEQQKHDMTEEQKTLHWQTWHQGAKIAERKVQLETAQNNSAILTKQLQKLKDRTLPVRPFTPPTRTFDGSLSATKDSVCASCGSSLPPDATFCEKCGKPRAEADRNDVPSRAVATWPTANMPRANTEISEALKMIEELRQKKCSIEEKQAKLKEKQQFFKQHQDQELQKLDTARAIVESLRADFRESLAEKERKMVEKREAQEDEKRLLEMEKRVQMDLEEKKRMENLNKEIREKEIALKKLEDESYNLALNVQKHTSRCFRKPVPPPRQRPVRAAPPAQRDQGKQDEDWSAKDMQLAMDRSRVQNRGPGAASSSQPAPIPAPSQGAGGSGAASSSSSGSAPPQREGASGSGNASSSTEPPRAAALPDGGITSNPVTLSEMTGGEAGAGAAASSTDVPGGREVPSQGKEKEKKVMWATEKRFYICREGEEGWIGKAKPASEVMLNEGPARSLQEAVDFLKANPNYRKEVEYYLVNDEHVWWCIYKRGKSREAPNPQEKAQSTLKDYIKDDKPPVDTAPRSGAREKARPKAAEPTNFRRQDREQVAVPDEQADSNYV